jgi:hypothetical protein
MIIIICRVCHLPSLFVNSINFPALSTERRTLQAEGRVHQHDASAAVSTKSFLTHQNSEIVPKMLPSGFFNIAMERSTIFNGQFSMAMLYNQRVNVPKDPSSDVRRSCCTDCLARAWASGKQRGELQIRGITAGRMHLESESPNSSVFAAVKTCQFHVCLKCISPRRCEATASTIEKLIYGLVSKSERPKSCSSSFFHKFPQWGQQRDGGRPLPLSTPRAHPAQSVSRCCPSGSAQPEVC